MIEVNRREMWKTIVFYYCQTKAKLKSNKIYPEDLNLDLNNLLMKPREVKVVIIDDHAFPWKDAIESRGCSVTYLPDYTKPITQANQKLKIHELSSYDIIICDIHGVGGGLYPGAEGLEVLEDIRRKNPLHVIAAYTGNPGVIYSKMKHQDALDMVFSKDWEIDDFLLNFDELLKIFNTPQRRWKFIRERLSYLNVGEQHIEKIRKNFVEDVLISQMLRLNFKWKSDEARQKIIDLNSANAMSLADVAKIGIATSQIYKLMSPFLMEASK